MFNEPSALTKLGLDEFLNCFALGILIKPISTDNFKLAENC
jgi:hypothetical protein